MIERRSSCYFCFGTLNPQDQRQDFQEFVRCTCNATYHTVCWHQATKCLRCMSVQAQPFEVVLLSLLPPLTHVDALPVQPSRVVYSIAGISIAPPTGFVYASLNNLGATRLAEFFHSHPLLLVGLFLVILLDCVCLTGLICVTLIALKFS